MRHLVRLVLLAGLLWPLLAARAPSAAAATDSDLAPGRVIVKMREGRGIRSAQAYGALSIEDRPRLGAQLWHTQPGDETALAQRLANDPNVEYAEPDRIQKLNFIPNDTYYGSYQWNLPKIGAPQAWDITRGSSGVIVAVIDSGFDLSHPDRPANLLVGCDYVRWRTVAFGGACPYVQDDENGHGTHVGGIVAARSNNALGVSGVAPDVSLLSIRTAGADGQSYVSDVASAIREATDAGAKVINLSLGGPSSTTAQRSAVNYAISRGVVVVAASGNEYQDGNPISYPAAYSGVIGVGAATFDDRHADYSNTGSYVSIVAPGGNGDSAGAPNNWITSLYPVTKGTYRLVVGTSQAAPHVAGAAGLMFSAQPSISGSTVASLLKSTARTLGGAVPNATFGYGYLDANAAVRAAQGTGAAPTATPSPTASPTRTPTSSPTPSPTVTQPSNTPVATSTPAATSTPSPTATSTVPPAPTQLVRVPAAPAGWQRQVIPLAPRVAGSL